jgi:Mn2+/Fe2+ NRAMP family transporter
MFIAALALLYLIGARGLTLLALALLASGIVSFVVLSKARDRMSSSLTGRLRGVRERVDEFRDRLDEGASVEDED